MINDHVFVATTVGQRIYRMRIDVVYEGGSSTADSVPRGRLGATT